MNYEMELSQHRPAVFNTLNGGVPPLVAGSGSAIRRSASLDTNFSAFSLGYEATSFTLEVWFLPLTNTGELVIIGHGSEGVLWDGSSFVLRVKQGDGTVITQSTWTPTEIKAFHVVMTYSPGQVNLFVDGQSVTNLELIDLSFSAPKDAPVTINGGTGTAIYDSLALYYRALTALEIQQHYNWGNSVPDSISIAMAKGATTWELAYPNVDLEVSFTYDSSNFDEGFMENVNILEDNLIGVGEWRQSIVLFSLIGTTSAGIHVTYEGEGVIFSYSLDGTLWITAPNKTTILEDSVLEEDAILYIRLELSDENSWVRSLRLDVLASKVIRPASGSRNLTFKSVSLDQTPGNQLDYHNDAGATIKAGGLLTIGLDQTENPVNIKTVEFWAKFSTAGSLVLSDGRSAVVKSDGLIGYNIGDFEIYINDIYAVNNNTIIRFNEWNFFSVRFISADNKIVDIAAPGATVYGLATYSYIPTGTYQFNVGAPALRVDDTSGLTVTESASAAKIHAYSWSYVPGGG